MSQGPPRLTLHTEQCPCISIAPEAMCTRWGWGPLKDAVSAAQKALEQGKVRDHVKGVAVRTKGNEFLFSLISLGHFIYLPTRANDDFSPKAKITKSCQSRQTWSAIHAEVSFGPVGLFETIKHGVVHSFAIRTHLKKYKKELRKSKKSTHTFGTKHSFHFYLVPSLCFKISVKNGQ